MADDERGTGHAGEPGHGQPADSLMDDEPEWTEEDEARYQARRSEERHRVRRRRRQGTSFAFVVLLVLGIGIGAAGIYRGWWEWPFDDDPTTAGAGPGDCPAPSATVAAPVEGVTVTVLNATAQDGLARMVADELAVRGFGVADVGNDDADIAEAAHIRYGPEGALQAQTVAAHVPGGLLLGDAREGTTVELVIGSGYAGLTPPDVAAAALAPAPAASPSGCVTPAPSAPAATPTG